MLPSDVLLFPLNCVNLKIDLKVEIGIALNQISLETVIN
jgi:hypothetical protein